MRSMTGFGATSGLANGSSDGAPGRRYTVDIRSFNHRFVELKLRLPPTWGDALLEQLLGQALRRRIHRGSLIVSVREEASSAAQRGGSAAGPVIGVNRSLVDAYRQALTEIDGALTGQVAGQDGAGLQPVELRGALIAYVAAQPGVLTLGGEVLDPEQRFREIEPVFEAAITALLSAREREGAALSADLRARVQTLTTLLNEVTALVEAAPDAHRRRLSERLSRLLDGSTPIDGQRLAQEVALMADRMDVSEEITRLRAHFSEFARICAADGLAGRHLEFLTQEMGREVNTIGSKSQSAEVAARVVAMKAELERLREQIQNVE